MEKQELFMGYRMWGGKRYRNKIRMKSEVFVGISLILIQFQEPYFDCFLL